jgi:hypothetical protein
MLLMTAGDSKDKGAPLMSVMASFGKMQFGSAPLGHKKRTECLVKIADLIHRHPGGTLPMKLHQPKDYKAMDRLMNRPEVTHASVLAAPCERTRQLMRESPGVVLVLHDTTELDYSGLLSIPDLGSIGGDLNRGFLCHNSLAFDPQQQEVLGLANQILHRRHCREKRKAGQCEGVKQKRDRQDRESRLWLSGATAVGAAPAGKQWVHVADRGADGFEFVANLAQQQQGFVVRSCSNRVIRQGHNENDPKGYVKTYALSLSRTDQREVTVSAKPGSPKRQATVSVGFARILLWPPHVRRGEYEKKPLRLWVVCVREDKPPKGTTPLEWILLTNVPVTTAAEAWERSGWYERRWVLEEYHKAQKTGCAIEELQFTSAQALEPMIGLLSVVAVTLLNLREAARRPDAQERPAHEVVDPQYVRVLSGWRHGKPKLDWSVHDFFMALARLGGHQNRKRDHRPGWLVLWRGWMALQHMIDGAEAIGHRIRGES